MSVENCRVPITKRDGLDSTVFLYQFQVSSVQFNIYAYIADTNISCYIKTPRTMTARDFYIHGYARKRLFRRDAQ